jgi:hypothetical protein
MVERGQCPANGRTCGLSEGLHWKTIEGEHEVSAVLECDKYIERAIL